MENKKIVIYQSIFSILTSLGLPLLEDHQDLVNKHRENLKLPDRPLNLNTLFNAKVVALLTEDDPMLSPIVEALQNKVETVNANSPYFKHFTRDLHESDGLSYMDVRLVIPFTLRNAMMKTLHETHPGQFGKKYLAQYIWWPHINRQIYFHGIDCSECTISGKNLQSIIPNSQISELPATKTKRTTQLRFCWTFRFILVVKQKHFTLHRSIFKIFFGKNYLYNLFKNSYQFSADYIFLHGIPYSIRVDHASCFTSQDFKSFLRLKLY